ncbi:MAG: hypothetical protein JXA99_13265 [Candidatus Lokiarchaeota archaeon]|nr:hypothetical protein [Candidatus Lokiarchaeota archaeon]
MEEEKINEQQKIAEFKEKISKLEKISEKPKSTTIYITKNPEIKEVFKYHNIKKSVYILFFVSACFFIPFAIIGLLVYVYPEGTVKISGVPVNSSIIFNFVIGLGIFFLICSILLIFVLIKKSDIEKENEERRREERQKKSTEYAEGMNEFYSQFKE